MAVELAADGGRVLAAFAGQARLGFAVPRAGKAGPGVRLRAGVRRRRLWRDGSTVLGHTGARPGAPHDVVTMPWEGGSLEVMAAPRVLGALEPLEGSRG